MLNLHRAGKGKVSVLRDKEVNVAAVADIIKVGSFILPFGAVAICSCGFRPSSV
jgi:hypothetical protein